MVALKQLRRGSRLVKSQVQARQKRIRKARKLGKTWARSCVSKIVDHRGLTLGAGG